MNDQTWIFSLLKLPLLDMYYKKSTHSHFWCIVIPLGSHSVYTEWGPQKLLQIKNLKEIGPWKKTSSMVQLHGPWRKPALSSCQLRVHNNTSINPESSVVVTYSIVWPHLPFSWKMLTQLCLHIVLCET